jgi:DNA-binding beta-propeller fold protein YncE
MARSGWLTPRCRLLGLLLAAPLLAGCGAARDQPDLVWGKRGIRHGDLVKPRAIAVGPGDRLYLVDWTARIQAFDRDGKHLGKTWTTPDFRNGRPSGLSIDHDGNLVVSDSHYHRVHVYSPDGELLRTVGGTPGTEPGQLAYVSAAVRDQAGNFYVAEFGETQRISKFNADGDYTMSWGAPGSEPGQFARIRAMTLGPDGYLYVADACNHRIQVFTKRGTLVRQWGTAGKAEGELSYPYDLAFGRGKTRCLYVVEYGNHRVQKFTPEGASLGCWGGPGREPGRLCSPWALGVDSRGQVHVVDSDNDRVQRIDF